MYQSTNSSRAMETRDHFKNGANPQSHTSKKTQIINYLNQLKMKKIVYVLAIALLTTGCDFSSPLKNFGNIKVENGQGKKMKITYLCGIGSKRPIFCRKIRLFEPII